MKICCLVAAVLIVAGVVGPPSLAFDDKGQFMTGGGAGGVSCPDFLNAMATARQKGGLQAASGLREIDGFAMYVLGFETGFNSEAEGIYDIFSAFGSSPANKTLFAIEPWCASHPDKNFADAVLALAATLRTKHE